MLEDALVGDDAVEDLDRRLDVVVLDHDGAGEEVRTLIGLVNAQLQKEQE